MASSKQQGTALITGAGQRLGRSIALKLAGLGYTVAIHYNHSQTEALNLAKTIRARKGRCEIFQGDLFDPQTAQELIPRVYKKFRDLNLIVNSASIFEKSTLNNYNPENLERNFALHVQTPYILTAEFAKLKKPGQIINLLDTHIVDNRTDHFEYLFSKKALAELTKLSAVALAPDIRVNGIAPGFILPPKQTAGEQRKRLIKNIPLKRKGDLENITQTVEFLVKNTYLTGQIIFVDGGEHLI